MADVVAWLCYIGDRRLVAVKQKAQEELGAHPKHA